MFLISQSHRRTQWNNVLLRFTGRKETEINSIMYTKILYEARDEAW